MNQRQVRYNMVTDIGIQERMRHEWSFFILNSKTEIDRIQERILEHLAVCDDLNELDSGILIPKEYLHGRLITFKSEKGKIIDRSKIYDSNKFYKDRNLHPMNDIKFEKYCQKFIPR